MLLFSILLLLLTDYCNQTDSISAAAPGAVPSTANAAPATDRSEELSARQINPLPARAVTPVPVAPTLEPGLPTVPPAAGGVRSTVPTPEARDERIVETAVPPLPVELDAANTAQSVDDSITRDAPSQANAGSPATPMDVDAAQLSKDADAATAEHPEAAKEAGETTRSVQYLNCSARVAYSFRCSTLRTTMTVKNLFDNIPNPFPPKAQPSASTNEVDDDMAGASEKSTKKGASKKFVAAAEDGKGGSTAR